MKPGIELDALIAEKVMGWVWVKRTDLNRNPKHPGFTPWTRYLTRLPLAEWQVAAEESLPVQNNYDIPLYSTDIAAAWEVVKRMKNKGFSITFVNNVNPAAAFKKIEIGFNNFVEGDTEAHAICLAALKSVEFK